jgi:hypothetical protein
MAPSADNQRPCGTGARCGNYTELIGTAYAIDIASFNIS